MRKGDILLGIHLLSLIGEAALHCTDAITALGSDIIIAAFYVNSSTFPTEKKGCDCEAIRYE